MSPRRDTPYIKVQIELDSYEIANLFAALEMVPNTGDWMHQIIGKIEYQMHEQGINPIEFYFPPNSGMDSKSVRRHLDILDLADRHDCLRRPKRNDGKRKG